MSNTVTAAQYLFTRLRQCGLESIFGVPGDYNLRLLDYVEPQGLNWIGNCNELNAGYAADGYAKVKGIGALITTFGVGELSTVNAIAGSYAERVPVVHVVGTPARVLQESRAFVHHTLGDGNFNHFAQMYEHLTVAQADLWDPRTIPSLIDSTIQQCLLHSRPVYIRLPDDLVATPVSSERLHARLELPKAVTSPSEGKSIEFVLDRIYASKQPIILVDGESKAFDIVEELHNLIKLTELPTFVTGFGKSLIEETLSNFYGVWKGALAPKEDQDFIQSCDLILCFGPHFSNTNTNIFASVPDRKITLLFGSTTVSLGDQIFRDVPVKQLLAQLLKRIDTQRIPKIANHPPNPTNKVFHHDPSQPVTQADFYTKLSPFFRPGDIILAETGTAGNGCTDFVLPPQTILFKPVTWLSIGYMLPATLGAALAQREARPPSHHDPSQIVEIPVTVLLIGDGSFQMTAQELSTIIHQRLNVLLFLINNDGYTIERCIHGRKQSYNDVAPWKYLLAPALFGAREESEEGSEDYTYRTATVRTWGDMAEVLKRESHATRPALSMVEVFMDREDAPANLLAMLRKQTENGGEVKAEERV